MTTVRLVGVDGSSWDLLDRSSPIRLSGGLGGLHLPKVSHQWAQTARGDGSIYKGSVTESRSFTMNIAVGDADPPYRVGADWFTLDAQFWTALAIDAQAQLIVNEQRTLSFRLDENNEFDFAQDPSLHGHAVYPVACIADDPKWYGAPATTPYPFTAASTTNYYGGTSGLGPPFNIVEPNLFSTALVANPGDLPSWPVWAATGPADAFRVGVNDHVIEPPFALAAGDVVIIDTEKQTITDPQGNDLWPLMGYAPVDFAPIPPGDLVQIAIGMDNPGDGAGISVTLTPRFRRAWGVQTGSPITVPPSGGSNGGFGVQPFGTSPFGGGS